MSLEANRLLLASVPNRRDILNDELEAMAIIGRVLDGIDDPAVRDRVLRWTNERFHPLTERPPAAAVSSDISHADSALAIDSLADLFPHDRPDREESREKFALVTASGRPERTLRSFVTDVQRLAKDWHDS